MLCLGIPESNFRVSQILFLINYTLFEAAHEDLATYGRCPYGTGTNSDSSVTC